MVFGRRRLRFYENGVTSFNLPICGQDLGGRSSRTTHPKSIAYFTAFLSALLDSKFVVENPFLWKTKADVLLELKATGHADLCANTSSCTHLRGLKRPHTHCGQCSQCLERRIASVAADMHEEDPSCSYASDVLIGELSDGATILFERYIERARELEGLSTPASFVAASGEVARALRHVSFNTETAAAKAFDLHKRHAEQVLDALAQSISRHSNRIVSQRLPARCLLAIVCRQEREASAIKSNRTQPDSSGRLVSCKDDKFELVAFGKRCPLKNTKEYAAARVLVEKFEDLVPVEELRNRVWGATKVSNNAVQGVLSNLRRLMGEAHINELEVKSATKGHYTLRRSVKD